MKESKFNYYNNLSRKIATALPKDDAKLDTLIDKLIDKEISKPGVASAISKPFKKLYFNIASNRDNLRKGIRNLYDPTSQVIKQNIGNYIANDFSEYLRNNIFNNPSKTLSYLGDGITSIFNNNPNNTFRKINKLYKDNFSFNELKDIISKNINKKDLFNKLNSGYFNNPETAKLYAKNLDKKLKSIDYKNKFKNVDLDPIGMLAKYKTIKDISSIEKNILSK